MHFRDSSVMTEVLQYDLHVQVSTLIEQIVEDESQMEGLLHNCSRVMVWHLHVDPSSYFYPQSWFTKSYLNATASLT